jgi:hypothetical protein
MAPRSMKTMARERDTAEILRRLHAIRPDATARWGRMSAVEMVCHLIDACRMATGEQAVSPATGLAHGTIVKWFALYVPLRWPKGIPTRPEIDQALAGTCPGDFAADIAILAALVERIAAMPSDFAWPPHPIFGGMSRSAWLRWAYLHTDHHLRQFGL